MALTGMTFAQTTPAKAKPEKATKPATTATTKAPAAAAGPTKKDGTPDMRYKANKDAAAAKPVHLKKDGTADKRFKENKDTKSPKKS